MRPCDIDRTDDVWTYRPESHKGSHLGHDKAIAVGPKAQAVILRYLARDTAMNCFRPIDAERKRGRTPRATIRESYSVDSYRRAVERAAKRAGVDHWTPHRLRHTRGTEVRARFGLDAAQAVLGHRGADVTQVYAEVDLRKAAEVARLMG